MVLLIQHPEQNHTIPQTLLVVILLQYLTLRLSKQVQLHNPHHHVLVIYGMVLRILLLVQRLTLQRMSQDVILLQHLISLSSNQVHLHKLHLHA